VNPRCCARDGGNCHKTPHFANHIEVVIGNETFCWFHAFQHLSRCMPANTVKEALVASGHTWVFGDY